MTGFVVEAGSFAEATDESTCDWAVAGIAARSKVRVVSIRRHGEGWGIWRFLTKINKVNRRTEKNGDCGLAAVSI
jgi:hypothetical protein